jgi:cysteine synthase
LSYAGREIWQQTRGKLHAFVSGAGTGGTIAGVSRALKDLNPSIQVVLADPQGSSLFNKVRHLTHGIVTYVVILIRKSFGQFMLAGLQD